VWGWGRCPPHLGRPRADTTARRRSGLPFEQKTCRGVRAGMWDTVGGSSCKRPHRCGSRLSALLTGRERSTPRRWQRSSLPVRRGGGGSTMQHALGLWWVRVLSGGAPGGRAVLLSDVRLLSSLSISRHGGTCRWSEERGCKTPRRVGLGGRGRALPFRAPQANHWRALRESAWADRGRYGTHAEGLLGAAEGTAGASSKGKSNRNTQVRVRCERRGEAAWRVEWEL
jgi:hypothetical protein